MAIQWNVPKCFFYTNHRDDKKSSRIGNSLLETIVEVIFEVKNLNQQQKNSTQKNHLIKSG